MPGGLGQCRGLKGAFDHCLHHDIARVPGDGPACVGIHHLGEQALIERAPVDPDPHRLVVSERHLDDGPKVLVVPLAADIPGIDAVLGQGAGAVGILGQQQVAVVVEVADDRNRDPQAIQPLDDRGDRRRRRLVVDRHPDQLAAGAREIGDLLDRSRHVGGVGVGHRLDDDGMIGPDPNATDGGGYGATAS